MSPQQSRFTRKSVPKEVSLQGCWSTVKWVHRKVSPQDSQSTEKWFPKTVSPQESGSPRQSVHRKVGPQYSQSTESGSPRQSVHRRASPHNCQKAQLACNVMWVSRAEQGTNGLCDQCVDVTVAHTLSLTVSNSVRAHAHTHLVFSLSGCIYCAISKRKHTQQ